MICIPLLFIPCLSPHTPIHCKPLDKTGELCVGHTFSLLLSCKLEWGDGRESKLGTKNLASPLTGRMCVSLRVSSGATQISSFLSTVRVKE
ncbi:MAG: hypothetical protein J3Q66DRAFT_341409 [Benniella sp.]|nr:MAG: hypothetical protein J3Q66DRAFT_341409 [Benniella sp.]